MRFACFAIDNLETCLGEVAGLPNGFTPTVKNSLVQHPQGKRKTFRGAYICTCTVPMQSIYASNRRLQIYALFWTSHSHNTHLRGFWVDNTCRREMEQDGGCELLFNMAAAIELTQRKLCSTYSINLASTRHVAFDHLAAHKETQDSTLTVYSSQDCCRFPFDYCWTLPAWPCF